MMYPVVGAKEHLNESMFSSGIGGKDCIHHDEFEMQISFYVHNYQTLFENLEVMNYIFD